MFFLSCSLLTVIFQGGKSKKGRTQQMKGKRIRGKSIRKNPYALKSLWYTYFLLVRNAPRNAFKNIITNSLDLSINQMNVRIRNRTSVNFKKSESFLILNRQKKCTFLQPFTVKVQGILITFILLLH